MKYTKSQIEVLALLIG